MNSIEKQLCDEMKHILEKKSLTFFQESISEILSTDYPCSIDWVVLFQKIYLHACLKGKQEIAEWLKNVIFQKLDPIQQIAIRHVFSYGKHLLSKYESRH